MTKQMKQTEWEKRFDKLADDLFVRNVTTPDIDTDIHLGDSEEACDKVKAFIKQEIKGILNLDIFANKYSSRFVNKGILMAYDAIKEHIEGKKEEPKGEQNK